MSERRFTFPDTEPLPKELQDLERQITALPEEHQGHLSQVYQEVANSTHRRRRLLAMAYEALSQLRLDVKYLAFDLEATRREKWHLEQQLEGEEE